SGKTCYVHMLLPHHGGEDIRHAMVFFCFSDFTIALLLQDRVAVIIHVRHDHVFLFVFSIYIQKHYMDSRRGLKVHFVVVSQYF
ncbi:hypothetical protein ACJX0J_007621, partial [Zea mays]